MGILKTLWGRLQIAVLLTMALSMLALVGCGDAPQAPVGAVMTAKLIMTSSGTPTAGSTNSKQYRVSIVDAAGIPMNGLKVNLYGTFSAGDGVNMGGASGTVPLGGVLSLKSSIELNGSGIQDFWIFAPTIKLVPVPTPVITGLIDTPGSGSLIGGTEYIYQVSALDAKLPTPGETALSVSRSIISAGTATNNAVQISWAPVNGASAYNVYGCASPPCTLAILATVPSSTSVYLDRTNSGSGVAGVGPAGLSVNTVTGVIEVQSGSLYQILDVSLP